MERNSVMTNREIKFELAKIALVQCVSIDSIKQMYEWIIEEPEVKEETTEKNGLDSINIKVPVTALQHRLRQYSIKTISIRSVI